MASPSQDLGIPSLSITAGEAKHKIPGDETSVLHPNAAGSTSRHKVPRSSADKIVLGYLRKHEPVFSELDDLRDEVMSPSSS